MLIVGAWEVFRTPVRPYHIGTDQRDFSEVRRLSDTRTRREAIAPELRLFNAESQRVSCLTGTGPESMEPDVFLPWSTEALCDTLETHKGCRVPYVDSLVPMGDADAEPITGLHPINWANPIRNRENPKKYEDEKAKGNNNQ